MWAGVDDDGRWQCRIDAPASMADPIAETSNLLSVCNHDHHEIHAGRLHVTGNPDNPDSLVWTDHHDNTITGASRARPPTETPPEVFYIHPLGERANWHWYDPPAWN